jgi:hypothetical protein
MTTTKFYLPPLAHGSLGLHFRPLQVVSLRLRHLIDKQKNDCESLPIRLLANQGRLLLLLLINTQQPLTLSLASFSARSSLSVSSSFSAALMSSRWRLLPMMSSRNSSSPSSCSVLPYVTRDTHAQNTHRLKKKKKKNTHTHNTHTRATHVAHTCGWGAKKYTSCARRRQLWMTRK